MAGKFGPGAPSGPPGAHGNSAPPAVGVPTTTPIAFLWEGALYLERMNILAFDGAGILCDEIPPIGTVLPVVFRLSTAKAVTRCKAEVLGTLPTTPAGLTLRQKHGDKALPAITGAGVSDSATAIFRLSDLKPAPAPPPGQSAGPEEGHIVQATGFCLHFLELSAEGKAAIKHHLTTSKQLADRLAAQGMRSITEERLAIADTFTEGDLSRRALDW